VNGESPPNVPRPVDADQCPGWFTVSQILLWRKFQPEWNSPQRSSVPFSLANQQIDVLAAAFDEAGAAEVR